MDILWSLLLCAGGRFFSPAWSISNQNLKFDVSEVVIKRIRDGQAIDDVFAEIAEIIAGGKIAQSLRGPVAHTRFTRLS
jgi:hypothetical protein